uniref:Uncharacterized protein n=1 Tax=Leersia perrieri TaxID=77586 RepID=A0A0D9WVH5_9ORYZ
MSAATATDRRTATSRFTFTPSAGYALNLFSRDVAAANYACIVTYQCWQWVPAQLGIQERQNSMLSC